MLAILSLKETEYNAKTQLCDSAVLIISLNVDEETTYFAHYKVTDENKKSFFQLKSFDTTYLFNYSIHENNLPIENIFK